LALAALLELQVVAVGKMVQHPELAIITASVVAQAVA
jgi:hypothetical protein